VTERVFRAEAARASETARCARAQFEHVGGGNDAVAMPTNRPKASRGHFTFRSRGDSAGRDFQIASILGLITLGLWLAFGWHRQWWFILWDLFVAVWWIRAQFRVLRR
jgi:hypothetical protein